MSKTDYEVDILLEGLTEELSYEKEIEFIKLYKDLGYCEANMSVGGEGGSTGVRPSEKTLDILREQRKGIKNSRWMGYVHTPFGIFETTYEAAKCLNIDRKTIEYRCKSIITTWKYWFKSKDRDIIISPKTCRINRKGRKGILRPQCSRANSHSAKKVINVQTKIVYGCVRDAAEANNIKYDTLRYYLTDRLPNKTDLKYLKDFNDGK